MRALLILAMAIAPAIAQTPVVQLTNEARLLACRPFSVGSLIACETGEAIVLPKNSTEPNYEAELAFVIGRGGRHIWADGWKRHNSAGAVIPHNNITKREDRGGRNALCA